MSIPTDQGGFGADSGVARQERNGLPYQGYILPKELRKAMISRRKKTVVHAGSRRTTPGDGNNACQRSSVQLVGKRKSIDLAGRTTHSSTSIGVLRKLRASARDCSRCHGLTGCVLQPEMGPSDGGTTYTAIVAGPVAP